MNVIGSVFKFNKASGIFSSQCYGGAIRTKGNAYIDNSTFENNTSEDYGGAVYAKNIYVNQKSSNLTDMTSFFSGNKAGDNNGGALYAEKDLKISNSRLLNNHAKEDGGAAYCNDATVMNCEFSYNSATGALLKCYGGALLAKSAANLYNSSFCNNVADNYGGAVASPQVNLWGGAYICFYNNTIKKGDLTKIYVTSEWCAYISNLDVYIGIL